MIKFKNKNVERETEIRYLTYITGRSYSHNDGVKHLTNVIQKKCPIMIIMENI